MTFIQLVSAVRSRMGIQGSGPTDVSSATAVELDIVESVQDTWNDIQSYRQDWKWMKASDSFNTVAATKVYSAETILGYPYRLRKWDKDTFYATINSKHSKLTYYDYDKFIYLHQDETSGNQPAIFTIRPWDSAIIINYPDAAYPISLNYWKSAQSLSVNSDTPELPSHFHRLIMYGATANYAASIGEISLEHEYTNKYNIMLGELLRDQCPAKTVKQRPIA